MSLQIPWTILDALQAGALLALAISFGAAGLARKDRMVSMVAMGCLLMSLQYGVTALGSSGLVEPGLGDRLQTALASLAFLAILDALKVLFPEQLPRRIQAWAMVLLLPNFLRALFVPLEHFAYRLVHWWVLLVYLAGGVAALVAVVRARRDGDPMGVRLMGGFILTSLPLLVEISALVFFNLKLRVGGLSIVMLAITIGTSWQWFISQGLQERISRSEEEAAAWRRLTPAPTWHTREISPLMEGLFGSGWERRLQDRMVGIDGLQYELHRIPMVSGGQLGWVETRSDTLPGGQEFLQGWTIALGMDDGLELDETRRWLESWGGTVKVWGTVPPREGPYPSILVWGREPSILAVWREDDLVRRRSRWVQVGGAQVEGPHERIDRPVDSGKLCQALQRLLSFGD